MKLLFERLVEQEAGVAGKAEFDLKGAVRANVQRLVANRVLAPAEDEPDVLSCGLPNVVDLPRDSRPALEVYGARIRRLIEHYEPRLTHLRLDIQPSPGPSPYRVVVNANLASGGDVEAVSFPLALQDA